jgi:hypothetical protein
MYSLSSLEGAARDRAPNLLRGPRLPINAGIETIDGITSNTIGLFIIA